MFFLFLAFLPWLVCGLLTTMLQEDSFHARPSVQLQMPDHLKALLVDDWENVTKSQQLVPVPHPHPVTQVLNDYLEQERPKRVEGSASMEVLEETVEGLFSYFDKCLGRLLLYRYVVPSYLADSWYGVFRANPGRL